MTDGIRCLQCAQAVNSNQGTAQQSGYLHFLLTRRMR